MTTQARTPSHSSKSQKSVSGQAGERKSLTQKSSTIKKADAPKWCLCAKSAGLFTL